jgi:hypothetical protein
MVEIEANLPGSGPHLEAREEAQVLDDAPNLQTTF